MPNLHVYVNPGKRRQSCIVGIETRRDETILSVPKAAGSGTRGPFTMTRVSEVANSDIELRS